MRQLGEKLLNGVRLRWLALAACWLLLAVATFVTAMQLRGYYPALSLRYNTPLTRSQADGARIYAAANPESAPYWPTYWSDSEEELHTGLRAQTASCLWFSGDGQLVYPARFIAGGLPGELQEDGLCVSTALAWALWGSTDVAGFPLRLGDKNYKVSGVFSGDKLLALVSCGNGTPAIGWRGVALAGSSPADSRAAATAFATATGLGEPDTIIDGPALGGLFVAAALLCCLLPLGAALLRRFAAFLRRRTGRGLLLFLGALLLALCLPWLLSLVPASLIPSRWSDFGYWPRLLEQQRLIAEDFFAKYPLLPDVEASMLLCALAALCALVFAAGILLVKKRAPSAPVPTEQAGSDAPPAPYKALPAHPQNPLLPQAEETAVLS